VLLLAVLACAREGVWTINRDGEIATNCAGEPPTASLAPIDAYLVLMDDDRWTLTPVGGSAWLCLDREDGFVCSGPDAEQDYRDVGLEAVIRWDDALSGAWDGVDAWTATRTFDLSCEGDGCAAITEQGTEFCQVEEPLRGARRGPLPAP
jgi:hypothetical protein